MSPGSSNFGRPPAASRTTSWPSMVAWAVSFSGFARAGTDADGSANKAKLVLVSPAGTVVGGALKPGGRLSSRTSIGPSKSSMRSAFTAIAAAPPFVTAGAVGLKETLKLGLGSRTVRRKADSGPPWPRASPTRTWYSPSAGASKARRESLPKPGPPSSLRQYSVTTGRPFGGNVAPGGWIAALYIGWPIGWAVGVVPR